MARAAAHRRGQDGGKLGNPTRNGQIHSDPRVRETCGEILRDGTVIDLVAIPDQERLGLLFSDGKEKPLISPAINRGGILYYPPDLHPTVRETVTFPIGAAEYGKRSQGAKLRTESS